MDRRVTSPTWSPPPPCKQALKAPEREKKQFGFGVWIHWFRLVGRPIRVKKRYAVSKISGFVWA